VAHVKETGSDDNEMCDCGDVQTMSQIANSCPSLYVQIWRRSTTSIIINYP